MSQLSMTIVGWNGFVPQFVVIAGWYYVTVLYIMITMEWLHVTLCHDRMDLFRSSVHSHNGMVPVLYTAIMGWFQSVHSHNGMVPVLYTAIMGWFQFCTQP